MTEEITYVDDPFSDEVNLKPQDDFEKRILAMCSHRKSFPNAVTARRIRAIHRRMGAWQINMSNPPKYPTEYIEGILKWCEDQGRSNTKTFVTVELVIKMIRDPARLGKWLTKQGAKPIDQGPEGGTYAAHF